MQLRYIYILFLSMLVFAFSQCNSSPEQEPITGLTKSWEKAVPHQEIPEGLVSLKSKDCGVCHQEHYKEWLFSTHAHAWTDVQFQGEIAKETSPFMCINCHIPLQNQQEYIISGLYGGDIYKPVKKKNPNFDIELQQEGINCASCHVRHNAIIGPTGTDKAPHKTLKDAKHLSEELCISCHNAVDVVTPQLACSFESGDEWKVSGFPQKDTNCISCHMPVVERSIVAGYPKRKSHYHYFAGSGIPKVAGVETKMLIGIDIQPRVIHPSYKLQDSAKFAISIKNSFAGHRVPTGDPERFIIIAFETLSLDSTVLDRREYRIGEHWEWHPVAKKVADNNLDPGEERIYTYSYLNKNTDNKLLHIEVSKHRTTPEHIEYNKLPKDYPAQVTIYDKYFSFKVE